MTKKLNQPQSNELVFLELEGVKKRLANGALEQKIAALTEAFNYGEAGLELVIEVLKDPSSPIQSVAYLLLKERAEQQVKEALQQYYREKIKSYELDREWVIDALHELRIPLNAMTGLQKLILDGMADDPEEERDFLEEAHKSGMRLRNLLNDIQDMVLIEADKMHLELAEVKLDEVFKDVENFRTLAQEKNLSLSLEMPTNYNEIILYSNYDKLQKVIAELLKNAIKYTHKGEIKIRAEVINKKVSVNSLQFMNVIKIEVNDTGIGVYLDQQNNLFKPFFDSGRNNRTQVYKSTGIGLALSKGLVKKMGGEMIFYSLGEGLGSTVTFTIPMSGLLK
jgi:hypothetical protein